MSKTKTKRMVASFLLLCAMSGTKAFANPDPWKLGDSLIGKEDVSGNILFDEITDFSGLSTSNWYGALGVPTQKHDDINITLDHSTIENPHYTFNNNVQMDGGSSIYLFANPDGKEIVTPGTPGDELNEISNVTLTINGTSEFKNNNASGAQGPGLGGAIYTEGANVIFNGKSDFTSNTAKGSGGAISNNGVMNFNKGAGFYNNTSNASGGAIQVAAQGEVTISGGEVIFQNNTATNKGGAIYNANKVTLDSSDGNITFSGNTVNGVANDIYLADATDLGHLPAQEAAKLTLQGDANTITFNGSIEGEATTSISNSANKLVLNGDNSGFLGTYKQTAGATTTVGAGGKFFGGNSTISSNSSDTPSNLILNAKDALVDGSTIKLDGTMYQNYSDVNVYINDDNKINGNFSGLGYIYNGDQRSSASTVTLTGVNSGFKGTYFQNSGDGKLVVAEGATSFDGTNIITGSGLELQNGSGLELQNGSTLLGQTEITDAAFTSTGATIAGAVDMFGTTNGDMTGTIIDNTFRVVGGTLNLKDGNEISTADGAKGSLVVNGGVVNINQDLTLGGTGNGVITNDAAPENPATPQINLGVHTLTVNGDTSGYNKNFTANGGTVDINDGGKFFSGTNTFTNSSAVTVDNGELSGTNIFNASTLTANGATISGSIEAETGAEVTIASSNLDNATFAFDGGTININQDYTINDGDITGTTGTLAQTGDYNLTVNTDVSSFVGTLDKNGGTATVDGQKFFGGQNNIYGGAEVSLSNGAELVADSTTTLGNDSSSATLNIDGSTVNGAVNAYNKSDINLTDNAVVNENITLYNDSQVVINDNTTSNSTVQLNGQIISDAGSTTSNVTLKGQNLDIKADQSGFKGTYTQEAGTTNVEGGSLFGVANNIKNGVVNMKDDSSLAKGSTLQMSSGTTINIENKGADHNAATNNIPATTGNETVLSGAISSEVDKAGAINVTGENTYLVVDADMSGYTGTFTQDNGATTEVTENGVFFAGTNVLNDGHFIFRDNAQLGGNVTVASKDVHLAFGDGSQGYKVEDGNHVYYYNSDGSRGEHSFIMNYVTITDSLDGGQGDYKVIDTDFGSNGGFANTADYDIKQQNDGSKTTISFRDGSVAQDGAQLNLADVNTEIKINANYMEEHATSSSKDGVFGADISGIGTVNVYNTNSKDKALTFISDNSGFSGAYKQTGGSIRFEGQNGASHFFDGVNELTNQSCVAFGANSVIHGTNYVDSTSTIVMENGSSIDKNDGDKTRIILQGGTLSIENTDKDNALDLNIPVENNELGGNVNKTAAGALTISADQHEYTGNYTQTGEGKVTVNAHKSFFGGTNNINNGIVDLTAEGAKVAGQNTISSTSDTVGGKMQIGDKTDTTTYLKNPIIVNTVESDADAGLELVTKDGNSQNLEVAFAIASGADNTGRVTHSGNGTLNLNNAGQNDLFENFKGTFAQTSTGVTNVFGNSFEKNDIQAGTLNMKNGSKLADGTTNLGANGTLNIGTLANDTTFIEEGETRYDFDANSTVTIASSISGTGKVNISEGQTTITGDSNNSGFRGNYTQTGDSQVTAQSGSTFFGGVNNLIQKGILFFKQGAKLADNSQVKLDGNTYDANDPTAPIDKAILDLDDRTNAVFNGNKLTLSKESATDASFVFTDGILQNAVLHDTQNIAGDVAAGSEPVITLGNDSGFGNDAKVTIAYGAETILASGSVAENGSMVKVDTDSVLGLVSDNLDYYTKTTGAGSIGVTKDPREENAPNINIYNDQSRFTGDYTQDAGRVTVKNGATFFGGTNEVTGTQVTDSTTGEIIKSTSGDLYLEKGSLIGSDIKITNFDKTANAGVSTPHGRVFIEDKIYDKDGNELTDIDKLMDGDLYYNTSADGSAITQHNIKIENAGLILSNGTIFDGSDGPTVFENKGNGGVVDIGFSNGTGVDGDIVLKRDTMLSYGDNAYIKDDSTLEMEDTAILNFINDSTTINYNPEIVGGGSIYKEGLGTTNISSAIDMTGEVKVSEGTLNFTNKDKVIFNKGDDLNLRQTGNLTVGSGSSNASISIVAKDTVFGGDVTSNAQDGTQSTVALNGKNTTIGGNLSNTNTNLSILGNSSIGGDWTINGNSGLNLVGNYSNTIDVAGDLILGDNLKDGKLPVAFDYDPHRGTMDTILVDSFQNDSNSPLLITGINFVTSPVDRNFDLSADRLIQQRNPEDTPYYDATSFYANTAMGRYFLSNGAGGADFTGTLVHLNPQQYRGQVATIASWQNQLLINNLLFDHMDIVTRQLMDDEKTANKYAASIPQFAPYQYDLKGGSLWYKAYGNFETLSMTKGLSVGNNAYGALIGADFPLIKLKHGWNVVPTAYIGYNGAHQHFNGVSMYQNGAQLGVMGTAYKGDFLTSLLAYGGGYGNDMSMSGPYGSGSDNTGNWFAGVASKTAYNFHLPADFIFQPTVMAAYNAFGSQNWGSDFGVMSMSSGMLNGLNVAPGFNLIWQKKSFNIYLTAQMVYNIMGGVDGKAGNVDLGYVRMRHSYFEYGLGVSKNFKDRFGGFLQFVIRNGGRTGIGFSGGLQFKVGK